jgi:hypothetical protein
VLVQRRVDWRRGGGLVVENFGAGVGVVSRVALCAERASLEACDCESSKEAHRVRLFLTRALESIGLSGPTEPDSPVDSGSWVQSQSDSSVDSDSWVKKIGLSRGGPGLLGPNPIGLVLGLGLSGPKQIGLFLGLGLLDPRPVGLWFGLGLLVWSGLGFGGRAPPRPLSRHWAWERAAHKGGRGRRS